MKMRIIFTVIWLAIFCSVTTAQNYFQVETDLMDPITAKGGSLFLTHGFGQNAITLGAAINQLPEFLNDQSDDFTEKRNLQATVEFTRFFNHEANGLYFGANVNFSSITIEEYSTNAEQDLDVVRLGVVVGYVWMPWNGFVINPFVNPRINIGFDDSQFASGKIYKGETLSPFGGLKIGMRF